MLHCPCDEIQPGPGPGRPQLFNWITILLLTGWVVLVTLIALGTNPDAFDNTVDAERFIRELLQVD